VRAGLGVMVVEDVFESLPVLSSRRLRLRGMSEADDEALFGIFSDEEVCEYYAWEAFTDREQARELALRGLELYRQRKAMRWGLVLHGSDRVIGTCGYTRWDRDNRYAVLGYDLARPYWRQGLMSEAVAAVLRWGFEHLALHRVEATTMLGNTASDAVLVRAGFHLEGRLVQRHLHHGTFHDLHMYGLLRSQWSAGQPPPAPAT
jgi:ribosomal-protein-alanine N-acetyltransferase